MNARRPLEITAHVEGGMPPAMWKIKDLCRYLGVSKRWVHERTRRREIPSYRFGTSLRFDPEEIRAWRAKFHHPPEENTSREGAPGRR